MNLFFMQEVEIPGANMTSALVFIDTVLLAGKSDHMQARACIQYHLAQSHKTLLMINGCGLN